MLIQYLNEKKGECVKELAGKQFAFKWSDNILVCEVPYPECDTFLMYPDLFKEAKEEPIDTSDIDQVIEFANSVQTEIKYDRRHKLETILANLKDHGYEL